MDNEEKGGTPERAWSAVQMAQTIQGIPDGLPTELVVAFEKALTAWRVSKDTDRQLEPKLQQIATQEHDLYVSCAKKVRFLKELERRLAMSQHQLSDEEAREVESLRKTIAKNEDECHTLKVEGQGIANCIQEARQRWNDLQIDANKVFETLLVNYGVLPSQSDETSSTKYVPEGYHPVRPGSADVKYSKAGLTYKQASKNLEENQLRYWSARKKLSDKDRYYTRDCKAYVNARGNRPALEVKEEFDRLKVVEGQRITREVISAEAALRQAKQDAKALGVWVSPDQDSQFGDHPDDGYVRGEEGAWLLDYEQANVQKWLDSNDCLPLPPDCPGTPPEVDTFSFDTSKPFDSVSMIADDPGRRRIDEYRRSLGQNAAQPPKSSPTSPMGYVSTFQAVETRDGD
ncbi:hypothetical protein BU16DRAFT_589350 [Lophium mytilinum]|uniref:Uncharacterized protein n=1 Tax=Lophium mytilinum TaxID=390894 RepID=A0A6A6QQQ2_9PEZI|nr:hypothetical protein BU16DRAFT_589350 [Lophium mytilinum]